MKNTKYQQELNLAKYLAVQAGNVIMPIYYGDMNVSWKEDKTPVTNADVLANQLIQEGIQKRFPLDGIVSEELASIEGTRCWYIDPIDGTRSFVEHTDQFAVHIGLAVGSEAVIGVVYKPVSQEIYFAEKDQGAYCLSPLGNKKRLKVQEHQKLISAMDKDNLAKPLYQELARALGISRTIISGSEGLRVMKVAEGITDVHFNLDAGKCSSWDLCAPQIIAEEAGAYVRFTDGSPILYARQQKLGKKFIVANSKDLAERISELINDKINQD